VCDAALLTPQQEQTLATGFNWYAQRRAELILELEEHVAQLQQLLEPVYAQPEGSSAVAVLGLSAGPGLTLESAERLQVRVLLCGKVSSSKTNSSSGSGGLWSTDGSSNFLHVKVAALPLFL
jgi:hypothetical protein